jgi:hypothetical protein
MHSHSQSFQTLNCPSRLAFELTLPDGTTATFATTGNSVVDIGERYWNSSDGELYRVTNATDRTVEVILEFGCNPTPRPLTFDCTWFTPDGHHLHHVACYSPV